MNTNQESPKDILANWLPVVLALLLGILANYLFYQQPVGISAPIFVGLGMAALYGLAHTRHVMPLWRTSWLAIAIALFSILVAIRAEPFVSILNIGVVFVLTLLLAHTFTGLNLLHFGLADYIHSLIVSFIEIIIMRPITVLVESSRGVKVSSSPRLAGVLRGLVLAVPILLVFTVLLSSADAAFEALVRDSIHWLRLDNLTEITIRLIFSLVVAWGMLGGFAYSLRSSNGKQSAAPSRSSGNPLGMTEAAIILGSVDLLFAIFVGLQFRYFFGGQSNIHVAGLTYAEYARRGFAELVVVAIFSLGLVLLFQYLTSRHTQRAVLIFEGLAGLLALLTGVMLVSAFQRLLLYEQAYGFTELRFFVHVFMVWMGVLLAVFLVSLHFDRPRWFAFGLLLVGLGFIMTLNVLNTDAFIVRQNLARYEASGKLDAEYLTSLSDDAIPGLLEALPKVGPVEHAILGKALRARLNELERIENEAGWMAWHYAHSRAYSLLLTAKPDLQK